MAFIDHVKTVTLMADMDYSIRVCCYNPTIIGRQIIDFKDRKIISKGDMVEVPEMDLNLYRLVGFDKNLNHEYVVRKVGSKKSYKVPNLYFLEGADNFKM